MLKDYVEVIIKRDWKGRRSSYQLRRNEYVSGSQVRKYWLANQQAGDFKI